MRSPSSVPGLLIFAFVVVGCGGGSSSGELKGSVQANFAADYAVNYAASHPDAETPPIGSSCPDDATFLSGVDAGATVTVDDANHKTVAVTELKNGVVAGRNDFAYACTLTFSAKLPSSNFYTVSIDGLSGTKNYSKSQLDDQDWKITLKADG